MQVLSSAKTRHPALVRREKSLQQKHLSYFIVIFFCFFGGGGKILVPAPSSSFFQKKGLKRVGNWFFLVVRTSVVEEGSMAEVTGQHGGSNTKRTFSGLGGFET